MPCHAYQHYLLLMYTRAPHKPVLIKNKGRNRGRDTCLSPGSVKINISQEAKITGFGTRRGGGLCWGASRHESSSRWDGGTKSGGKNQPSEHTGKKKVVEIRSCKKLAMTHACYTNASIVTDLALFRRVTFLLTVYTKSSVQKWYICACAQGIEPKIGATSGTMT
jgi:hypothetical protein